MKCATTEVRDDGSVWSKLLTVHDANGTPLPNVKDYPLDFRWEREVTGNSNRPAVLKDRTIAGLEAWLDRQGRIGS
jgi:hypothetical protein